VHAALGSHCGQHLSEALPPGTEQSHVGSLHEITPDEHSQRRHGCPAGLTVSPLPTSVPSNMQPIKYLIQVHISPKI
jgi:hypothetical protein